LKDYSSTIIVFEALWLLSSQPGINESFYHKASFAYLEMKKVKASV